MHNGKMAEVRGPWVRWSRYDLLNGVVVPAEGAEFQVYDPWENFRANVGKYRTVEQPYTALLELHRNLKEAEGRNIRPLMLLNRNFLGPAMRGPRNDAERLILDWCNRHGLLGLVPVLSNSIRVPPAIEAGDHECTRIVTKLHHFREGGIWTSWRKTATPTAHSPEAAEAAARKNAEEGPKPSVRWMHSLTHDYEEKKLEHIRDYFLPTAFGLHRPEEEPFRPPCPNTRAFWDCYGEPVWEFVEWCEIFALSVNYLSRWEGGATEGEAVLTVRQSNRVLTGLAQSAAHAFQFDPERNTTSEERVSAGLIASYALMFLWDRTERRRTIECQNCGSYFVSDEKRARYCSPRCRNTAQSRRYRSKKEA
jgi:hypothetical protein